MLMLVILVLLSNYFLDDFFIYANKKNMIMQTKHISLNNDLNRYRRILSEITKNTGGKVLIYDENLNLMIGELTPEEFQLISREQINSIKIIANNNLEDGFFSVAGKGDYINQQIIYGRILDDGSLLVIIKGMGLVNEARRMFINFLGITSVIVYFFSFILIYFYADRFTRPIIKLRNAARKIAGLEFDNIIEEETSDEIGDLIVSVNTMAIELSSYINALNESNDLLEKELSKEKSLEKMRRRFVSDVSHELKNPISLIISYSEGFQKGLPKTKEDRDYYIQVIHDEGKRMNQLVKDMLDLSSYETGTFSMKIEEFNMTELVKNAIERFSHISNEKSIHIDFCSDETYIINGDRIRLGQVVINLISNVFKHVNHGGCVRVNLSNYNNKFELVISNTGKLIPENELENIWKSFYQIDTDTDGNGLGLTIVKSIVGLHGGEVFTYVNDNMNHFKVVLFRNI